MDQATRQISLDSPVGPLCLTEVEGAVASLGWTHATGGEDSPVLRQAKAELQAYFDGTRRRFTVPLRITGSTFQRAFLQALTDIPYGETREYGDLAKVLGVSAQAIGQACGANPIPILIPCHRVLSATGLGGYSGAGGVETKVALLRREGAAGLLI